MRWAVAADYVLANYLACKGMHYDQLGQPHGINKHACGYCLVAHIAERAEQKASEENLRTAMMNGTTPREMYDAIMAEMNRKAEKREYANLTWPRGFLALFPELAEQYAGQTGDIGVSVG